MDRLIVKTVKTVILFLIEVAPFPPYTPASSFSDIIVFHLN